MEELSLERYLRHQAIHWIDQKKLLNSKVLVIGAGAIGNELLKNLALMGTGYIYIIDFDTIQIHNLTRSVLFRENDVGKSKVKIVKERLKELNPHIKVDSFYGDFYEITDLEFLKQFDSIFSVTDNFEARIRLHRLTFLAKKDFFNAGIDSQYVSVEYYPYHSYQKICFECNLNPKIYQNIQKRYSCGWVQKSAFVQKKIPTTIITSSIAASCLMSLFLKKEEYSSPVRILFDTIYWNLNRVSFSKHSDCFFCSSWQKYSTYTWQEFLKNQSNMITDDTILFLNEPVLKTLSCPQCGFFQNIWELSRKFKDIDLLCPHCGYKETRIEISDHFTIEELPFLEKVAFKYLYFFSSETTILVYPKHYGMERRKS